MPTRTPSSQPRRASDRSVPRREFLQCGVAGLAAAGMVTTRGNTVDAQPAAESPQPGNAAGLTGLIDVNVYLSRWPFRRIRGDAPRELIGMLRSKGVTQAWTGSFDGVFHKDMAAVNARLAEECAERADGFLIPFGTVDPTLPNWESDLRRCHEEHQMPGIRLHPNYHQYALDNPACVRLLNMAAERGLIVQLVPWLEDERHHPPLMPVPEVDFSPLPAVLDQIPELRLLILNGFRAPRGTVVSQLLSRPNVYCDLALLDVIDGLGKLLAEVPIERVFFGSYSPMFYFDSTALKLREAALSDDQIRAICCESAAALMGSVTENGGAS